MIQKGIGLEQDRITTEAMLNRTLGRSGEEGFGEIGEIKSDIPDWSYSQVWPVAKDNNPDLLMEERKVEMNQAELQFAKADLLPDFMVRGMYKDMENTPDDFWALMVGVTLPFAPWSAGNYGNKVKENRLYVGKAQAGYSAMENMVSAELRSALSKISAEKQLIAIYENTLIPQAEQTLGSTLAAYRSGKTDFLMTLDGYRMQLMAHEDYEMAVMEYMSAQAGLEKAVGLGIPELAKKLSNPVQEKKP